MLDSHELRTLVRGIHDIEVSLINEWARLRVDAESYTRYNQKWPGDYEAVGAAEV